ncbi:MAG: hypothetical protein K6T65_05890 [Peptococcaceae bacterium]|nr:hypothetical protein [Peptococcaceae bacterium]
MNQLYLLPRFAANVYGAVFGQDEKGKFHVDPGATAVRRLEIRKERAARAIPAAQYIRQEREKVLRKDFSQPVREMYAGSMELSSQWAVKFRTFWNLPAGFTF